MQAADGAKADGGPADAAVDAATADMAQPAIDVQGGTNDLLQSGEWFFGVQLPPFGNLNLPFKMTVVTQGDIDKGGLILAMQLRAMSSDLTYTSDPIATVLNVPVAAGGAFKIVIANTALPAKASPTQTDVPLSMVLEGKITSNQVFCGSLDGEVPQFSAMLTGSTFKAVPWGKQTVPYETSCAGNQAKIYKHLDVCPALLPGENTLTSAERSRTFLVQLPKQASSTEGLPVIFLYHGVGGQPDAMIETSGLTAEQAKGQGFVLVAPRSERDAKGKAVLKTDWYYTASAFDLDNSDLVFFDDLLHCVGNQWKIDKTRVYAMGMSGGGLMSTFVAVHRPKAIAAAAPFSGGYLHPWPKEAGKMPLVFSWGGPTDKAFEQDFDKVAESALAKLKANGNFVVACNHLLGHKWPKEGGAYAAEFLLAHKPGADKPFANGLPANWPAYCKIL
ncbi:MAG: hypothetical protein FJ100_02755 [Deltaproteobacteria bacterium]|nr:hypothetical protein [Deltaproteobacteria bacterium]